MGGQQFATDATLIDMRRLNRVLALDTEKGIVEVEAGIQWPDLMDALTDLQDGGHQAWTIAQKQTGADSLTIGGAIGANIHGRGLTMAPFGSDVESLVLIDATGETPTCSRTRNADLFRLVLGGYGLFGVVYSARLRLIPRQKVQRIVEVVPVEGLIGRFEDRITNGFRYGDFQYVMDEASPDFLRLGVFSCYRPVPPETPFQEDTKHLTRDDWRNLAYLAHTDKARAFQKYADHYLSTSGQIYWSDTHQLAVYLDDYHQELDRKLGVSIPATEVITELFVPRHHLSDFLEEVREDLRAHNVNVIYGTIRLIEPDQDSYLAWAKGAYACIIFNVHVEHSQDGQERSVAAFRRLIGMAADRGGSYYLPYHRHATLSQVETCYPQFEEFLALKRRYDPGERFQSEWYRHYRAMFTEG
jgi:FAD/FMN-containing dehydrogenase